MKLHVSSKNKIGLLAIFIFCFLLATVAFFYPHEAQAEPSYTPVITVQNKTVHRGQTFELNVDISNNQGLTALKFALNYDNSVMRLTGIELGDALTNLSLTPDNVETELGYSKVPFNFLWADEAKDDSNGTIVKLIFESYATAQTGAYPVTLTLDQNNTRSDYMTPIAVTIYNGTVTLTKGAYEVIYRDWNQEVLFQKDYNEDEVPQYNGIPPYREEDLEYSYEFIGWKGIPTEAPENPEDTYVIIYEADYLKTAQIYTVFYYIDGYNIDNPEQVTPDKIIDENDYYYSEEIAFGSVIDLPSPGDRGFYKFIGWYQDSGFTKSFLFGTMPTNDVRLYGYYKFDLREVDVPQIKLTATPYDETSVIVTASMIRNSGGFNSMVLTVDYDITALKLTGFKRGSAFADMRFTTTEISEIEKEGFKFYISSDTKNSYETGEFLIMYFDIRDEAEQKTYPVGFTCGNTDASYKEDDDPLPKYTKVEFFYAEVPVGKINHWNDTLGARNEIEIDVVSEEYKPINVVLFIEDITELIELDDQTVRDNVGKKFEISSSYSIKLMQNGEEIEPNTVLTVKITLKRTEKLSRDLKLFYYSDEHELTEYNFKKEGDYLVFNTDHLSEWVVFTNYQSSVGMENYAYLIILPILLAVATMGYALIVIGKNRNKRRMTNE